MKSIYTAFSILLIVLTAACTSKNPDPVNAEPVKDQSEQQILTGQPKADLYANAIKQDDIKSRAKWSLGRVKEQLNASSEAIPGLGKVSILIDEELLVIIKNETGNDVYETRFNLINMNPDPETIQIIVNRNPGEFPGLKLATLDEKPGVDIYKNGEYVESKRSLDLFVSERAMVQRVASAMMQAIQAAHGEL